MDPNKPQLDPKLKAAYDRIMNTAVTPPQNSAGTMPPAQTQVSNSVPNQAGMPASAPAQGNIPPPLPNTPPPVSMANPGNNSEQKKEEPKGTISSKFPAYKAGTLKAKRGGNVPSILWVLLAVVFFVAYSLIWIRVLGVNLPFLP